MARAVKMPTGFPMASTSRLVVQARFITVPPNVEPLVNTGVSVAGATPDASNTLASATLPSIRWSTPFCT